MSDQYSYVINQSYGPFEFGMKPEEVHAILGQPESSSNPLDYLPEEYQDDKTKKYFGSLIAEDYKGAEISNKIPSFLYSKNSLIQIGIRSHKEEFIVGDFDLMLSRRKDLITALYDKYPECYVSTEGYFFVKLGAIIAGPRQWKYGNKSIDLVLTDYLMSRLEDDDWEKMDALEFF